ncbi:MAG: hypothetical protein GX896_09730, partial [Clostridiales bacterium]|nr:hypothetical protein [Clostridiales bacterium]
MQKIMKIVSVTLFFTLLVLFMILTIVLPKSDFSENENRALADLPKATAERYSDKSLMAGIDNYVSDHFALRSSLMSVKSLVEHMYGKHLQNGIYFADERMVELVTDVDKSIVNNSIEAINYLACSTNTPVYVMIAPTAAGIYSSDIPSYYGNENQKTAIEDIYYRLDDRISTLNVYSKLHSARDEYIYYRNDNHWTSYGAYISYYVAIKKMGYTPAPYSNYDVEHVNSQFRGTFYNKVLYSMYPPDVIDLYHSKSGNRVLSVAVDTGKELLQGSMMYYAEYLNKSNKYSLFLEDYKNPYVQINTSSKRENKLLVIKDSYA